MSGNYNDSQRAGKYGFNPPQSKKSLSIIENSFTRPPVSQPLPGQINQSSKPKLYLYCPYENISIPIDSGLGERMGNQFEKLSTKDSTIYLKTNENLYSGIIYKVSQSKSGDLKIIVKVSKKDNDMIYTIRPKDIIEVKEELKKTLESKNQEKFSTTLENSELKDVVMQPSDCEETPPSGNYLDERGLYSRSIVEGNLKPNEESEFYNKKHRNSNSLNYKQIPYGYSDPSPAEVAPGAHSQGSNPIQPSEVQKNPPPKSIRAKFTLSDFNLLIGELVYFVPKLGIIHLVSSLEQIRSKKIPDSYTKRSILNITQMDSYSTMLSNEISIRTALFYHYNKIDPSYPCSSFIGRKGYFLASAIMNNLKLLPKPKLQKLVENDSVELCETLQLPSLEIDSKYVKGPLSDYFRLESIYTNLNIPKLFISFPINTSFQFIISLALFENYYRFPEISALNTNYIKDFLSSSSISEIKGSFTQSTKNFKSFYDFVLQYPDTFKRSGDDICNLVNADYYTLSGLQKFSDQFQIIIEYSNYTDSPYKVMLNPTTITKPIVEIIHLGEFRRSFFILYPDETLIYEIDSNFGYKDLQTWPISRPFSISYANLNEEKLINIISRITQKITSFSGICINKVKGLNFSSDIPLDFQEEASTIKSLMNSQNEIKLNELISSLISINLADTIYNISIPKFTCLCCGERVTDRIDLKKKLQCGCEYKLDHYDNKVNPTFQYCFCGKTPIQQGYSGMQGFNGGYGGIPMNPMSSNLYGGQGTANIGMGTNYSTISSRQIQNTGMGPNMGNSNMGNPIMGNPIMGNPNIGMNPNNSYYPNQRYN